MRIRARVAVVITFALVLLGAGAGIEASAASAPKAEIPTTANNGCVVVPSILTAICLERF